MSYDVVVIGSGMGGLTAAVSLAQAGKKVLVLEQHYVPGGWCHSFQLEGYRFSPGVHYIGECGPGGRMARIFEGLGLGGDLSFYELNPEAFDHVRVGGERFDIPRGKERLVQRLKERFPKDASAIERYFEIISQLSAELGAAVDLDGSGPARPRTFLERMRAQPTVARHGLLSLRHLTRSLGITDPLLYAILGAQAGDHGLAPADVPAAMHAAIVAHYFDGGYYPKGGGFALPRALVRALKRAGGELRVRAAVDRILIDRTGGTRRAVGVRLSDGTEIRAAQVISNADPAVTFGRLLRPEDLSPLLRLRLATTRYSVSALSLFMAARFDARALGLDSGNYWVLEDGQVDRTYQGFEKRAELPERVGNFFLTITTLKDPTKLKDAHTMEAFTFVPYKCFERWAGTAQGERGPEYAALKARLKGQMLAAAERVIPGLSRALVFSDLGTPLTNQHYVAATRGNLYGTRKDLLQSALRYGVRTEIAGLGMCGASTLGHGVLGASISGLVAAASVLRCPVKELLQARGPALKIEQSEPSAQARAA